MKPILLFLSSVLASLSLNARAAEVTHYHEPGLADTRQTVANHFAEHIDPFHGNLSLQFVDLRIPGNGGFDLQVQRSYNANAIGETLSPFGRGWEMHFGRVKHALNAGCATAQGQSMFLELPDGSSRVLHRSNGVAGTSTSHYLTTSFWKGECTQTGILIRSPDGTQYDMSESDMGRYWLAKRITDRFGNYFDISYVVNVTTGKRVVSQVTANDGRAIQFNYSGGRLASITGASRTWTYTVTTAADNSHQLTRVQPPAGGDWEYVYNGNLGTAAGSFALQRVTNPFGGSISYVYGFVNMLPPVVGAPPSMAVTRKTAGADVWQFAYTSACQSGSYDTTTVTQPGSLGTLTYRHFGYCGASDGDVWKIGLLYQKDLASGQTETLTWTSQAISSESTARPGYANFDSPILRPLLASRTIGRDGRTYSTSYGSPDAFGNPGSITESGGRNTTRGYFNNVSTWIVGLPMNESINGHSITRSRNTDGSLASETRFGVTTSYSYFTDGAVSQKRTDKPATFNYSGYSKGVPSTETRPEGVTITRTVNAAGDITSESDGVSNWTFGRDGIGRITSIGFPTGSSATISWSNTSRTLTRGAYSETAQFDPFGRVDSITREGIARTFDYDELGRKTFESMPGSAQGSDYTLDPLGRVTRAQSPAGTKTISYANGSVAITNERGHTTRYDYDRYGDPDEGHLVGIAAPVGSASITMTRNVLGVLLTATQDGATRTYGRNTSFFLTSLTEPETGTTNFGRDGVGNMTSKTVGGQTVNYGYDGLSRLESVTGTGINTQIGYDRRGKVTSVNSTGVQRAYTYDANGNLTEDRLTVDGQVLVVGYGYDSIDGLASITYPVTNKQVTFAPDGLGRPTRAYPYLTNVTHRPSGNLSAIHYANSVTQSFGENTRQLPDSITAGAFLSMSYAYDAAGNVDAISNGADSLNLGYDAIDRLTSASGPWGSGSISYDGRGNITRQDLGSHVLVYNYSSNRLASVSGARTASFTYDGRGNMTGNGAASFTYDPTSQLTCVNCGGAGEVRYQYDGQGRRVSEEKAGRKTYFVQAPNGDLQFEYTPVGGVWVMHAYLHGKRVASETNAVGTTTTASSQPTSAGFGQSVTLKATVAPAAATGAVEFREGTQVLGTANLSSGQASLPVTSLLVGTRTVTANYLGDALHRPSSGTTTVTISKASSSTTLSASPAQVALGGSVTLTAAVQGISPTGSVQLREAGTVLGTQTLVNSSYAFSVGNLTAGTHSFDAVYLGDGNHNGSTSAVRTVEVSKGTPSVTVASSSPNSTLGQSVTFTATVSGVSGIAAGGSASFYDGGSLLGTAQVSNGIAQLSTANLIGGTHQITAQYAGDANYVPATSAAMSQFVSANSVSGMVKHLYLAIFDRPADPGGHDFYIAEIERLRTVGVDPRESIRLITKLFFMSQEYANRGRTDNGFLEDLYQTFFQRDPDAGGLSYWQQQMAQGLNREAVLIAFMHSAEFQAFMDASLGNVGQRAEVGMVMAGYRAAFGQLPDNGGLNYWAGTIRTAQCQGQAQTTGAANHIVFSFMLSYYPGGRTHRQFLADLYDVLYQRGPDVGGFNFWANEMETGARTRGDVIGYFVNGPEWSAKMQALYNAGCLPGY